ncbi:MAG: caspase family protein [Candidatus Xenobiia bacterium LiM19]
MSIGKRRLLVFSCLLAMTVLIFTLQGCGGGGSSDSGYYYGGDSGGSAVLIPTVTSCTNDQGGTTLTSGNGCQVSGTNFGTTRSLKYNNQSKVTFLPSTTSTPSVDATVYSYWSDTYITCTVPTLVNGTNYIVVVTIVDSSGTPSSSSDSPAQGNTITASSSTAVTITKITPSTQPVGGSITIDGTNFGALQGNGYVRFGEPIGGIVQSISMYWSNSVITVNIPTNVSVGSVPVYVVNNSGVTSSAYTMNIVSATTPYLSDVTPTSAVQGATITLGGGNLGSTGGRVNFGSVQQTVTTTWNSSSVTCVIPTSVPNGSCNVSVTTSSGTTTNAVTLTVGSSSSGKIYALFVGINNYPSSPLNYCVNDVTGMQANLTSSTLWSGASITTLTDGQATKSGIQSAFATLAAQVVAGDTFFFYYSGHGSNSGGVAYIIPVDSTGYTNSCISATELQTWSNSINTNARKFFCLDSCYSGGFIGKGMTSKFLPIKGSQTVFTGSGFDKQMETLSNMVFLAASTGSQTSVESSSLQHGAFTYYVMEGLGTGTTIGPAGSGGYVSGTGVFNYASTPTTNFNSNQNPQMQNNYGGDLIIKQ